MVSNIRRYQKYVKVMIYMIKNRTCCFLGHRKINRSERMVSNLTDIIENLIVEEKIDTFLFGSKSEFNTLCLEVVAMLKKKYPYIKRIYVRAEFPYIDNNYKEYLLEFYEDTYYPKQILNAGKAVYIKRNYEMINNSSWCVTYYDENYMPFTRNDKNAQSNSGTKIAYDYAMKKGIKIINIF